MKKILCVFIGVLFLCGCTGRKADVKAVTSGISCKAHIFYYGDEYECSIKADNEGRTSFLITKPENLKDFTIVFEDQTVKAIYKGLTYTPSLSALAYGGLIKEIYDTLHYFEENDYEVIKKSESFSVKGKTENNNFEYFITESGLPLNVVYDKNDFYIIFSEVTVL